MKKKKSMKIKTKVSFVISSKPPLHKKVHIWFKPVPFSDQYVCLGWKMFISDNFRNFCLEQKYPIFTEKSWISSFSPDQTRLLMVPLSITSAVPLLIDWLFWFFQFCRMDPITLGTTPYLVKEGVASGRVKRIVRRRRRFIEQSQG